MIDVRLQKNSLKSHKLAFYVLIYRQNTMPYANTAYS